ncbi:hypothetical protein HPB49_010856 [Dermacentor silvarum]|uniref:Uncharacterized protein n=1 Tax=Dermacentor silvarum TaxID=543639 RepID=A0ACB8CWL0_DERSI|nr:hypothetical protein HPB49_010856 [Dermacentor silvarum]
MTRRTQMAYEALFEEVLNFAADMGLALNPKTVSADFELAAINAIRSLLPLSDVHGCLFHLYKFVWRRVRHLGLAVLYKNDVDGFAIKVKRLEVGYSEWRVEAVAEEQHRSAGQSASNTEWYGCEVRADDEGPEGRSPPGRAQLPAMIRHGQDGSDGVVGSFTVAHSLSPMVTCVFVVAYERSEGSAPVFPSVLLANFTECPLHLFVVDRFQDHVTFVWGK